MTPTRDGSIRLFRFSGIDVYLHWSWLLVAMYQINARKGAYSSLAWNAFEYLALFGIVLLHEFGHSLACRQVGGRADQIVLWPLGGVAYVAPPQRPGATLWSIAAGPLVNVGLIPIFALAVHFAAGAGWELSRPDHFRFIETIAFINIAILIFNLIPVYPLDGGQILRSLLWYPLGRARSLLIATIFGFIGAVAILAWAVLEQSIWIGVMGVFIFLNCRTGWQQARALAAAEKIPRRREFACPSCGTAPPMGQYWTCGRCQTRFDIYQMEGLCPECQAHYDTTQCLDCGASHPLNDWREASSVR